MIRSMNTEVIRSDTRRVLYDEATRRLTDEKFIITVKDDNVLIECSGDKSEFYARNTLARLPLANGEHVFAPAFGTRGYIEGFYGKPWTLNERLSVMSLMAKHGLNTYCYAPKDDPFHRKLWRLTYPEKELSDLRLLIGHAKKNYMELMWCVAPGLDIRYSSDADLHQLLDKLKQLYDSGVRSFGLLLDDISETLRYKEDKRAFRETVNAHIYLIDKVYSCLKSHDDRIKLTVCPTLYHGRGDEYYIRKLGNNIAADISLFWTGRDICSRELTSQEAASFVTNTRHKPLYWDNYPVNDMAMHFEMHLGPLIGREGDLYKYSEGIISNCMEYAECSKIPLITAADYMWYGEKYDPESSWRNAIKEVVGKENAECFTLFADQLRASCLMDENAPILKALAFSDSGDEEKIAYLTNLRRACDYLSSDEPICRELKKWSDKFRIAADIITLLFEYSKTKDTKTEKQVFRLIKKYNSIPEKLTDDSDFMEFMDYIK